MEKEQNTQRFYCNNKDKDARSGSGSEVFAEMNKSVMHILHRDGKGTGQTEIPR
jgi:hypothetical protein